MTEQLFQIGIKAIIRNDKNQILLLKNVMKNSVLKFIILEKIIMTNLLKMLC